MNIKEAKEALYDLENAQEGSARWVTASDTLEDFINEVETLLKTNSIKQTPALLKAKK